MALFTSKNGEIDLSDEFYPLYIATWRGEQTNDQMQAFLDFSTEMFFKDKKKFAYVVDATRVTKFTIAHRNKQSGWLVENSELIRTYTVGVSFAFASAMHRGVLTAIHWVKPPVYEFQINSSRRAAIDWAVGQLVQAGVAPPENLSRAYRSPFDNGE